MVILAVARHTARVLWRRSATASMTTFASRRALELFAGGSKAASAVPAINVAIHVRKSLAVTFTPAMSRR